MLWLLERSEIHIGGSSNYHSKMPEPWARFGSPGSSFSDCSNIKITQELETLKFLTEKNFD